MKTKWQIAVGALLMFCALTLTQTAGAADVSGTWTMEVQTPAGSGKPTFILAQKGGEISGTYKGQLGEVPVTGTVKGDDIVLNYKANAGGNELHVTYTGKVEGNSMSGKVKLGELGEGTFKGTKNKS